VSEVVLQQMLDERFTALTTAVDALLPVENGTFLRAL
jgi:hypothetical protein